MDEKILNQILDSVNEIKKDIKEIKERLTTVEDEQQLIKRAVLDEREVNKEKFEKMDQAITTLARKYIDLETRIS